VLVRSGTKKRGAAGRVALAGALVVAIAGCSSDEDGASGSGGESPFEGENIEFVVPYDPGGGYDTYTRLIAPYMADCLGGAQIVVLNEPGAGSLLATNNTARAEPDGTRIQILNMQGALAAQIAGDEGAQYDLGEFSWIGRVAAPADVVLTDADGELSTFEDIVESDDTVTFVATGPGGSEYIAASVLAAAYDFPVEIATGFGGSQEASSAVIAGDAAGHVMPFDSVLSFFEAGDANPAVLLSQEVPEYMPDAPLIGDFPPDGENGEELVDQLIAFGESGRAVAGPPGIDEERLTALRDAFTCAMEDEELLAELDAQERPVGYLSGEETAQLVDEILQPTDEFRTVIEESF
jgi:tripartite-type tricarboxylate transporter receptor subunit TctC